MAVVIIRFGAAPEWAIWALIALLRDVVALGGRCLVGKLADLVCDGWP